MKLPTVERVEDSFVVDVENDVFSPKFLAPAKDRVERCEDLFDLYVLSAVAAGSSKNTPFGGKDSAEAFDTAGVRVNVFRFAFWLVQMDPVS